MRSSSKALFVVSLTLGGSGLGGCGGAAPVPATPTSAAAAKSDFSSLPPNGAIYGSFLASDLKTMAAAMRGAAGLFSELGRASDEYLDPALVAGLDGKRPVLLASVPANEPVVRGVVDAAASGAKLAVLEKLEAEHADEMTRLRIILPVAKGSDRMALANLVSSKLTGAELEACPKAASCSGFGGSPLGVSTKRGGLVVAYAEGSDLRIDLGLALLHSDKPATAKTMEEFRTQRGGPQGGLCSKLEATKSASFCFDRVPFAAMSASQGYAMLLGAISGDSLDDGQRLRIAKAGREEEQVPLDMARADVPATDGTLNLDGSSGKPVLTGSWALDASTRVAVAKSFPTKQCATGNDIAAKLAPPFTAAVRAKAPQEPADQAQKELRSGFAGIGMAAAGHWVLWIDGVLTFAPELKTKAPPKLRACVASAGDRVTVTFDEAP